MFNILKAMALMAAFGVSLCACSSNGQSNPQGEMQAALFKLAHMNGCIECHRIDATVVGPSWKAIAERYKDSPVEDARNLLIESVKKGSKGNYYTWKGGNGMPPMERRVSDEHIAQLVDYILSLNQHK